jgi:hypothetical protein
MIECDGYVVDGLRWVDGDDESMVVPCMLYLLISVSYLAHTRWVPPKHGEG